VKLLGLLTVPLGFVTEIKPLSALAGTVAVICVSESIVKAALTPAKEVPVALEKLVPVITIRSPWIPLEGVNDEIVGAVGGGGGGAPVSGITNR
jgi:hypothetical protein